MAGGQGTRLWPESTSKKPKQYLCLVSDKSLLQESLERLEGSVDKERRFVVTTREQESLAYEHTKGAINKNGLIFEPMGKNTAPCLLLSLAVLADSGAAHDDLIAVLPADHVILGTAEFQKTLARAFFHAESEKIITIGIRPTFPHTGYGYIHKSREHAPSLFDVKEFVEKPNSETAKNYLKSGKYLWNAGIFVAALGTFLKEFERCAPNIFSFFEKLKISALDKRALREVYKEMPSDSIDYAVMEKSSHVLVTQADFDWNDLGSWQALESLFPQEQGNALNAKTSYLKNAQGNIIFSPHQSVFLEDVHDKIIVSNDKALVILPKEKSQNIKDIVSHLKENDSLKHLL